MTRYLKTFKQLNQEEVQNPISRFGLTINKLYLHGYFLKITLYIKLDKSFQKKLKVGTMKNNKQRIYLLY